jgi:hypothetical protein
MNFIIKMLTAEGESYASSKRVITFAAFLLISIGFLTELFFEKKVSPQTFEVMSYIVIGGLGFTASEKLVKRKTEPK